MQIKDFKMSQEEAKYFEFKIPDSQGRSIYWCRQDLCLPEPPALVFRSDKSENVWSPLALRPSRHLSPSAE